MSGVTPGVGQQSQGIEGVWGVSGVTLGVEQRSEQVEGVGEGAVTPGVGQRSERVLAGTVRGERRLLRQDEALRELVELPVLPPSLVVVQVVHHVGVGTLPRGAARVVVDVVDATTLVNTHLKPDRRTDGRSTTAKSYGGYWGWRVEGVGWGRCSHPAGSGAGRAQVVRRVLGVEVEGVGWGRCSHPTGSGAGRAQVVRWVLGVESGGCGVGKVFSPGRQWGGACPSHTAGIGGGGWRVWGGEGVLTRQAVGWGVPKSYGAC